MQIGRREHMLGLVPQHERNLPKTYEPLSMDVPQLIMNTDDGYDPAVEEVVSFIRKHTITN